MLKARYDAELEGRVGQLKHEPGKRQECNFVTGAGDDRPRPDTHEGAMPKQRWPACPRGGAQRGGAGGPSCSSTTDANSGSRAASARNNPKHPASIMSPCGTARCGRSREPSSTPRRGPVTASCFGGDGLRPSSSAPCPMSSKTWSLESVPVASASR